MKIHRLSAREVAAAAVGKFCDGAGLWLVVRKNGSKAWGFRYCRDGRAREMGLGPLEKVSLALARKRAQAARELLAAGRDPIEARRAHKRAPTFKEAAEQYIERHEAGWKNPKHRAQWKSTLERYAYPVLGNVPVDQIEQSETLLVLDPIWGSKTETASRVRGRIEAVLDAEIALGHRTGPNPARWRGHLSKLMTKPSKLRKVKHHAAMPWEEVPGFMAELKEQRGIAAQALRFALLTACRSGEVRLATWDEIDLDTGTWTVPSERMKTGREHRVTLSPPALELLRDLPRFDGSRYVFPSPRTGRPLSDAALGKVLRDMGSSVTAHGFRSSFRDWAAESTAFPNHVCEQALAHSIGDKVEAAYRRGDLFEKRRQLMDAWSVFCTTPTAAGVVVPIRRRENG